MPTITETIAAIEVELEQTERLRDRCSAEVQHIIATATAEGRANLTKEEDERVDDLFRKRDQAEKDIAGTKRKLEVAQRNRADEIKSEQAAQERHSTGAKSPAYDRVARVGQEERTYTRESDPYGIQFARDVARQFVNQDPEAAYRLARHGQEERVERGQYLERAVGTGAFTGLTVPQYLTELYAPATAAMRPFADICTSHPLPEQGMSIELSRITTATSVDNQASENAAVAEVDPDDTPLSIPVRTAGGSATISRQAIDRGTGIDDVVLQDLFNRYATNLDSKLFTTASVGLSAVAIANAYTDTTATAVELYPKILGAASGVEAALLAMGAPTHAVMHSRRWYWLSSQLTTSWPLISQPSIPTQAAGTNFGNAYGAGVRGVLPNGLQVVVDNNITTGAGAGTNEDEIYVVPQMECHLWEDPAAPLFIRAEQPKAKNLGVDLVVYGYFAFTFQRYANAMQKVGGTGLTPPVF